ncbi:Bifunctional purple acid phosphatase 26 [Vitis vinifera]|uniref:acid phosphatase n=1 Tax=Vitis vinifera TaxID=29760 RepID=A0A438KEC9_VITVI|nr:Bifunctional purple acid phosphatase 26 [Vitis vinifera]
MVQLYGISQMVTSLSLEGYCTSLSGVFLVYSVCGRKWGKNSVLGRFVVFSSKFVWKSQVPFKVKSFVWLVAHKKVNTNDMLQVRRPYKALSPDICILCMKHGESADHLFLHCSLTIGLWYRLFQLTKTDWVPPRSIFDMMSIKFNGFGSSKRGIVLWQAASIALIQVVWWERNTRIFEDKARNSEYLWDSIVFLASLWAFCSKVFKGTPLNVLQLDWVKFFLLSHICIDMLHLIWPPKAAILFVKYTPQWKWLREELKRVDREKTPWLIVLMHAPMYSSNVAHYMEGESMRAVFESWFVHAKVDLIFAGHVLPMKDRTSAIHLVGKNFGPSEAKCISIPQTLHKIDFEEKVCVVDMQYRISNIHYNITNGDRYPIPDKSAPVYITVGDGGNQEGLAGRFVDPQPEYSSFREASYGHSTLEIKNRTHAFYHWNRNDDGKKVPTDSVVFYNQYWARNLQRRRLKRNHIRTIERGTATF